MVTANNIVEKLFEGNLIDTSYDYSNSTKYYWKIKKQITVQLSCGCITTIPVGFNTDLSSTPRYMWSILPPVGDFVFAAIVHDWLYECKCVSLSQANKEMLYWSNLINDNKTDNYTRYYGVCLVGWWKWYDVKNKIKIRFRKYIK